jgi:hypothetical protein
MSKGIFGKSKGVPGTLKMVTPDSPPAIRYVNLLLYHMVKNDTDTQILREAESLPSLAGELGAVSPPPLDRLLNRLKVLSGLNPVTYPAPVEGSIPLCIGGEMFRAKTFFDDASNDRCRISMTKEPNAQHAVPGYASQARQA